jgi:hypothetical protein
MEKKYGTWPYGFTINHRALNLLVPCIRANKVTISYKSYVPLDLEDVLKFLSDLQSLIANGLLADRMAQLNLSEEEEEDDGLSVATRLGVIEKAIMEMKEKLEM